MNLTAGRNMSYAMIVLLGGFLASAPTPAEEKMQRLVPSVTVVGSDKVSAKPDMAEIQVGVLTQAQTAAQALKANSDAMEKLFKALSGRGIAEKDQQTSNFSVSPQYRQARPGEPQMEVVGYHVSNMLHVRVRQLGQLGAVLDDLVSQGANQVHGVSFSVAEPRSLLDEARRKAIQDARRKAELYAKEAGVKVGKVLLIEEQSPHLPQPKFFGGMERTAMQAVPIAAGEQDFSASITVTYALE